MGQTVIRSPLTNLGGVLMWFIKFIVTLAFAVGMSWDAYTHDKWRWWIFLIAIIPCAAFAQARAGMRAELLGMTNYAMARPRQVIFWSLVQGAIYAAIIAALIGLFL
jgi:hypothetical protein